MKSVVVLVSKDIVVDNRYVRVKLICKINHVDNDIVYLVTGGEINGAWDNYNDALTDYNKR